MGDLTYRGAAKALTLAGGINAAAAAFTVSGDTGGWPSGVDEHVVVIGRGTAGEEKVRVTRSGTTFTVVGARGYDDTAAGSHAAGEAVEHVAPALAFQEADDHIAADSGVHGVTGDVVGTTDTQTLTDKTLSEPIIDDFTNAIHDHESDAGGGNLGLAGAWSDWTPIWTNGGVAPTPGDSELTGRYKKVERVVHFTLNFMVGSTAVVGSGPVFFSLPTSAAGDRHALPLFFHDVSTNNLYAGVAVLEPVGDYMFLVANNVFGLLATHLAQDDVISISGTYEAAS
jgi:hypothetical protein